MISSVDLSFSSSFKTTFERKIELVYFLAEFSLATSTKKGSLLSNMVFPLRLTVITCNPILLTGDCGEDATNSKL